MHDRKLPLEQTMLDARQIAGRILREPVKAGDAFLISRLYPEGMGPSLAERLKPGYRAVTVPIQMSGAVDGFAQPGSVVDIVFRTSTATDPRTSDIPDATLTLLERVEVLAVGGNSALGSRPDNNRIASVTLAVLPEQAQALKAVEGRGQLSFALRGPSDVVAASAAQDPVSLERLLGLKPQRPVFVAEIYRGAARQTVTFERDQVEHEEFGGLAHSRTPIAPQTPVTAVSTEATPATFADGPVAAPLANDAEN
jgi:Flp pilus assembly protein CpaB